MEICVVSQAQAARRMCVNERTARAVIDVREEERQAVRSRDKPVTPRGSHERGRF